MHQAGHDHVLPMKKVTMDLAVGNAAERGQKGLPKNAPFVMVVVN
jgi:hypothetical protein